MEKNKEQKRLFVIALFFSFAFSWLLYHFFTLTVIERDHWLDVAARQHYFFIKDMGSRGTFFSNTDLGRKHQEKAQPLVYDIEIFHLFVDPVSIPREKKAVLAANLSIWTGMKEEFLLKTLQKKSRSRKLKRSLTLEDKEKIEKSWEIFAKNERLPSNSLFFVRDFCRSYPFGKLLGQVLHTVHSSKDPKKSVYAPSGGLELFLDRFLKGKEGRRRLMRSPLKSMDLPGEESLSEKGADVYLTVNHYLQAIAEEEVEKGVKQSGGKSGFCIIMDPHTGSIYALAEYPFFFPAQCGTYFADPEKIKDTQVKAVLDSFEPGSTAKPFTLALSLLGNMELKKQGQPAIFDPDEKISVASGYFPGRQRPIKDVKAARFLNADMAMQKSSNIYFASLADRIQKRLGSKWYRQRLSSVFGIGRKTGIELPYEESGLLPQPGKKHPSGALEWSVPTPYSLAIGYNLQVTGIQLIAAHAILANGGYRIRPHLIRKIVKNEHVIFENTIVKKKILPDKVVKRTLQSMRFVTMPGGTSTRAHVFGFTDVGKSSTTIKAGLRGYEDKRYRASFLGWVPAENPKFIIFVMIDDPEVKYLPGIGPNHHGGVAAAPVFRRVASRSLEYLGVDPDSPHDYPKIDPRSDSNKVSFYTETRKLREKYETWNNVARHPS